ncbi:cobalamin biosynthesis protein, partial [Paenibacillus macerans]|nr:cobalamin biosynthesis protein [Paenibacillus macerans]
MRRDAPKHPSPNSGRPEAAVAGALGVRLGGKNSYRGVVSFRAYMGDKTR